MTVAAGTGETWSAQDGAPQGVAFEFTVRSKSEPGRSYRIARDENGTIWHPGACTAWQYGRRLCRHVRHAIAMADEPEQVFLTLVRSEYEAIGGALAGIDDLMAFWATTYRAVTECREIRLQQSRLATTKARWSAKTPDEQFAAGLGSFG